MNKKIILIMLILITTLISGFSVNTANYFQYLSFDSDYTDSSNNLNASNYGCTIASGGKLNNFASCGNGYVATNLQSEFNGIADITLHFWAKFNTSNSFSWGTDGDDRLEIDFNQVAEGRHRFYSKINNVVTLQATLDVDANDNDNMWHFYTINFNHSSGDIEVYIDNNKKALTYTVQLSGNTMMVLDYNFTISAFNRAVPINREIDFDEFAFYSGVLNSTDRVLLWNSGNGYNPFEIIPSPPLPIPMGYTKILFNDELIINNSISNKINNYWNVYLNESITSLNEFYVNFDGLGYNKIMDLPISNKTYNNYIKVNEDERGSNLVAYNNSYYSVSSYAGSHNKVLKINSNLDKTEKVYNLGDIPYTSFSDTAGSITIRNNLFYVMSNNGLVYVYNDSFQYENIIYNLGALSGNSLNGKGAKIYYDSIEDIFIISQPTDRYFLIFDSSFNYIEKISYSGPVTSTNRDITRAEDYYYVLYSNDVYVFDTNFVYQNITKEIMSFSDADSCIINLRTLDYENGNFLSYCDYPKLNSTHYQFRRYNSTLDLIGNYQTSYGQKNLIDGNHTIQFQVTNSTYQWNTSIYSFSLDTTKPIINNTMPSEINSYNINVNNYISCSDLNLVNCNITFDKDGTTINSTNTSYEFTYNGNQIYNIFASDEAGNIINKSGIILVNPYAHFRFNNSGTLLTNYTFGGINFNTEMANITLYDSILNIGNNNISWSKIGYITQSILIPITNTSRINKIYNVSESVININIYDKNTLELITGVNFTLTFIGNIGAEITTNTGKASVSNLLFEEEEYTLFVTSSNYQSELIYFNFNNQENLSLSIYLLESNYSLSGYINLFCLDKFGRGIDGAKLQALQWDNMSNSFIKVSEKKADYTGSAPINIVLDSELYRFKCIVGDRSNTIGDFNIPNSKNGASYYITLEDLSSDVRSYLTNGITANAYNISNGNIQNIYFDWLNNNGNDLTGCIKVYYLNNITQQKYLLNQNCSTTATGSLIKSFNIGNITNIYIIEAELNISNQIILIDSFTFYPDTHISKLLKEFGLYKWILPFLVVLSVGIILIGTSQENQQNNALEYLGICLLMASYYLGTILIPSLITIKTFIYVIFICIITMIAYSRGANK